jgi:septal ring factor EnvC (AmiA/AmiB activator)
MPNAHDNDDERRQRIERLVKDLARTQKQLLEARERAAKLNADIAALRKERERSSKWRNKTNRPGNT